MENTKNDFLIKGGAATFAALVAWELRPGNDNDPDWIEKMVKTIKNLLGDDLPPMFS